jgi:hypothetical protein
VSHLCLTRACRYRYLATQFAEVSAVAEAPIDRFIVMLAAAVRRRSPPHTCSRRCV